MVKGYRHLVEGLALVAPLALRHLPNIKRIKKNIRTIWTMRTIKTIITITTMGTIKTIIERSAQAESRAGFSVECSGFGIWV